MTEELTLIVVARTCTVTLRLFFAWILHIPSYGPNCGAPSPQFFCRSHNPQCDGIWRWGLWVIIGLWWGHERAGLHDGINVLVRRDIGEFAVPLSPCHVSTSWDGSHHKPGKRLSPELNHAGTLISDIQPPKLREIRCLRPLSQWYFVMVALAY